MRGLSPPGRVVDKSDDFRVNNEQPPAGASSTRPVVLLPDVSFLLFAEFTRDGFDLVITNPDGKQFIVHDYFSFNPPPNLVLENGAGLSPEMVAALMQVPFDGVMFAGPATEANAFVEIGKVTFAFGDVIAQRTSEGGQVEEVTLKKGDLLYKGDVIITGDRAFVKAQMLDGTRFHLGKNGRAALTDFEFDEANEIGRFAATVTVGGFHFKSGKIGKFVGDNKAHSTISTPSAIIGIRGSEADGVVGTDGQLVLKHSSGVFEVADINGNILGVLTEPETGMVVRTDGSSITLSALSPELDLILSEALQSEGTDPDDEEVIEEETNEDVTDEGDSVEAEAADSEDDDGEEVEGDGDEEGEEGEEE